MDVASGAQPAKIKVQKEYVMDHVVEFVVTRAFAVDCKSKQPSQVKSRAEEMKTERPGVLQG